MKTKKHYLFSLTVRDGEHEYGQYGIVSATSEAEADRKAFRKAQNFLGSKMKWNGKYRYFQPANGWEYRIVEYEGIIGEATPEALLSRLSW
jgi:hypothetical protein